MIRSLDSMLGSSLTATDGEIGKVYDIFFDDRSWAVRYLVVETGAWFTRRKVLISPAVLATPDWTTKTVPVLLTKTQVENSPDVDADEPVSRQQELAMARHYGWADYLSTEPFAPPMWINAPDPKTETATEPDGDPHLRSAKEVAGYEVDANNGALGHVMDFVVDDNNWAIIDLVVSVASQGRDHTVIIPTQWVAAVSWEGRRVELNQPREKAIAADFLAEV